MKVAPEHCEKHILALMGKSDCSSLLAFKDHFQAITREQSLNQYLTYYLMAAHPGCTEADMGRLRTFLHSRLNLLPEQVQIFTPTPSTYSSLMYYTERDPFSGAALFVEKTLKGKEKQKRMVVKQASVRRKGK